MQTAIPQKDLRAIIAEDDAAVRYTLRQIVETRCEVIAEAENGQVAVELAGALNPDIVLLDISMPILNGFEAARRIRNNLPHVSVIIVSSHSDPAYVEQAFRSGAGGYVFKGSAAVQLVEAIQHVSNGRTFHPT
jgi:DNA-binding NarL/FixJ family response regulator